MTWIEKFKAVVRLVMGTREQYTDAIITPLDARGRHGEKLQPYRYAQGVDLFSSWVYAASMLNANACAAGVLRLYSRRAGGGRKVTRSEKKYLCGASETKPSRAVVKSAAGMDDVYEVDASHPLLILLNEVNPWMDGYQFAILRFIYLQLTGNAYIYRVGEREPVELYLLPAQWMSVIPGERGSDRLIDGYVYSPESQFDVEFAASEISHERLPNPRSAYYGLGRVEAGWGAIQLSAASQEMDYSLAKNQARPDYAAIFKSGTTPDQLRLAERQINNMLRGPRKAGKVLTLTGDTELVPLNFPPKDMTGREQIIEEIASVFGVPITKLKANDPNRANAETGDAGWLRDTIAPLLRMDEQFLNAEIVPLFDDTGDLFLAYDSVVPANRDLERVERESLFDRGIITLNEARGELGYAPVENGDVVLVRSGYVPLATAINPPAPAPGFPALPLFTTRSHKSLWAKADAGDTERVGESRTAYERIVEAVRAAYAELAKLAMRGIDTPKSKAISDADAERIAARLAEQLTAALELSLDDAAKYALSAIDSPGASIAFDVTSPEVRQWLESYVPRLARSLTEERAKELQAIVAQEVDSGGSTVDMARRLRESPAFSEDGINSRAEMIARSETARAYTRGEIEGWRQSGVVIGKRWDLAAGACPFCAAASRAFNAAQPKLDDAPLKRGGSIEAGGQVLRLDYEDIQGPPLHPNCRCILAPVLGDST